MLKPYGKGSRVRHQTAAILKSRASCDKKQPLFWRSGLLRLSSGTQMPSPAKSMNWEVNFHGRHKNTVNRKFKSIPAHNPAGQGVQAQFSYSKLKTSILQPKAKCETVLPHTNQCLAILLFYINKSYHYNVVNLQLLRPGPSDVFYCTLCLIQPQFVLQVSQKSLGQSESKLIKTIIPCAQLLWRERESCCESVLRLVQHLSHAQSTVRSRRWEGGTDNPGGGLAPCPPPLPHWPQQGRAHTGGPAQPSGRSKSQAQAQSGKTWPISQKSLFSPFPHCHPSGSIYLRLTFVHSRKSIQKLLWF